ncbi:MAG: T9SS type A sorting domain-containing protein [Edaphocola sp.]
MSMTHNSVHLSTPPKRRSCLRTRLAALLLAGAGIFGAATADAAPTITYTTANDVVTGYSQGTETVKIVFDAACTGTAVRIGLPTGVSYVASSVTATSSTTSGLGIAESSITDLRSPVFSVSGTIAAGNTLEFTIARQADCASTQGGNFDSVYVTFSGGCTGASVTSVSATGAKSYNIYTPSLALTPASAISNAVIGTTATRTTTVINGGSNSAVDTLRFYVVYPSGAITNTNSNKITVGSTDFSPSSTSGDTLFYKIYGAVFPAGTLGTSLLENGETVTISEPVKVTSCSTDATVYGAGWGRTAACSYTTGTSSVTMATGVANIVVTTQNLITPSNFCDNATMEVVITNSGTETVSGAGIARNITQYIGLNGGEGTSNAGGIRAQVGITNPTIWNGTSWVSLTYTGGGTSPYYAASSSVALDLSQLTAAAGGLTAADGDGVYNDLPVGASITLRYEVVTSLAYASCASAQRSGIPYYQATYTSMCGTTTQSTQLAGSTASSGNGLAVPVNDRTLGSYTLTNPPDIVDGQTATIRLTGVRDFRTNASTFPATGSSTSMYSCPTNKLIWRIVVPKGISLSAGRYYQTNSSTTNTVVSTSTGTGSGSDPDTLIIVGSQTSYATFAFEADVTFNCANYVSGTDLSYTVSYICDSTCSYEERWYCGTIPITPHCGTCTEGGLTVTSTNIQRTTGGYTSTTNNTWVDVSSLTAKQLRIVTAGDSATATFTGKLIDGTAAPFASHYFRMQYTAPGGAKAMEIIDAVLYRYSGGTLAATTSLGAPTSTLSSGTHTMVYDLSSYSIATGDSIVLKPNFVILNNPSFAITPTAISDMEVEMYSLQSGSSTEYTCDHFGLELYAHRAAFGIQATTGTVTNSSGCATYTNQISVYASSGLSNDVYPGELRALVTIDSVKIVITSGDFFSGNLTVTPYGQTSSEGPFAAFSVAPSYSVGTSTRVYVNDGTWTKAEWNSVGLAYILTQSFVNGCGSLTSGSIVTTVYVRTNTTAHSSSFDTVRSASVSRAVSNGTMPVLTVSNNTGNVQGVQTSQYWDVTLSNTSTVTAPYAWFALEKTTSSGIVVDSVKRRTGLASSAVIGTTVTSAGTYGTANSTWYQLNTSIASGIDSTYRVYFHYSACNTDSIALKAGWNCSGYPTDPSAYTCTAASTYLKVVPAASEVQLSVVRQPGDGSDIDLCTTDSANIVINSAQAANLVNPYVTFTPPSGVTIPSTIPVEYPLGSGNYQNVSVTTSGSTYTINVAEHTAIIAAGGILGTANATTTAQRQAKVVVQFNTSCGFSSGTSFFFNAYANRPCGAAATGNGVSVATDPLDIDGATVSGGASVSLTFGTATATSCGNAITLSSDIVPTSVASSTTDTLVYTLPAGLAYAGNLTSGLTAIASGNTVKIGMPVVSAGNTLSISFDVVASGEGCNSGSVTATYNRQIAGLTCGTTTCSNSSIVLTTATSPTVSILKPDLTIDNVVVASGIYGPNGTYTADVTVTNASTTQAAAAGTYKVEAFCGSSSTPFATVAFPDAIAADTTVTANMSFTVPGTGCSVGDLVTYRIRPLTAANDTQCLCNSTSYTSSVALPVDLLSFNAYKSGSTAQLTWTTASEQNNKGFGVERSSNGSTWTILGFVNSKDGNSSLTQAYAYTDEQPASGINLYRLALTGLDGKVAYSTVRTVTFGTEANIRIYPNPANDAVVIDGFNAGSRIGIHDVMGRLLIGQTVSNGNSATISLNNLSSGVYQVRITDTDGTTTVHKLVKK